jgi:2-methylfumaryl-CoA isomerase
MTGPLDGLRIVEGASFIAAPICGLHLQQLGAEVIRVDPIGGGFDYRRWPLSPGGDSFYWEGLNKGKKSVAIDLSRKEGRDLLVRLATAPNGDGIFITNYPPQSFLSHSNLMAHRQDMITVRVTGWANGRSALDYTVNCAVGMPFMTGPENLYDEPANHALPAWDLLAGANGAFSLLAAERYRSRTGIGQEITVPLGEIAIATLGHLGQIAEVAASGVSRPRSGNDIFGAFGRDFQTADEKRVMIAAITPKQWKNLVTALGIAQQIEALESATAVSFATDEGNRFRHRHELNQIVECAVAQRRFSELAASFDQACVCWGAYNTLQQALENDPLFSSANPLLTKVEHPSGYRYLTPGRGVDLSGFARQPPGRAPKLGENTDDVLANFLELSNTQISHLHDQRIVA